MADLIDDIESRAASGRCRPFVFKVQEDLQNGTVFQPCKRPTIRRHIKFCRDLGLLVEEDSIRIHEEIQNIHTIDHLNTAIATRLMQYMESKGASFDKIHDVLSQTALVDPRTIFERIRPDDIDEDEFRACLNLLATVSDELASVQKKQYMLKNA